jgi:acyl-coenzyme A thioesterase 13
VESEKRPDGHSPKIPNNSAFDLKISRSETKEGHGEKGSANFPRRGIPAGFTPSQRTSAYLDLIGPIFEQNGEDYRIGLFVDERHVNTRGLCHGALLASLADIELGRILSISRTPRLNLVTVNLALSYLASAKLGDWLEAHGQIDRIGKKLAHSSGFVLANGTPVVRATGIFQVLDDK